MMRRFRVFGAILFVLPLSMLPFFKARAYDSGVFGLTAAIVCALPDTVLASVVPVFSNITPGGHVLITGCGFKDSEGKVLLSGLKKFNGESLDPVQLPIAKEFGKNDLWTDKTILALIPNDITMVMDQPVKIQVIRKTDNKASRKIPVSFRASVVEKVLPMSDVVFWCSTEADHDYCNGKTASSTGFCFDSHGIIQSGSAAGQHYTCADWFDDDEGTDEFQATLTHGWVFQSSVFSLIACDDAKCCDNATCSQIPHTSRVYWPTGFSPDTTHTKLLVDWITANYEGLVKYSITLTISGPAGVPHN